MGKTIFIYAEQGLGDTIQFSRYIPLLAQLGANVIFEVQQPLLNLLGNLEGVSQIIGKGEELPPFDYQCPLLSLPLAFNTRIFDIPAKVPYVFADPSKVVEWSQGFEKTIKKRVGLVWSSMSNFKGDSIRSLKLADFIKALPLEGFEYICLQKELKESDKKFFKDYENIKFFGDDIRDFSDTAALIDNLDLVVSTCTSVPHLSGALGKETWLLLSHVPDWRWLLDRSDSPWYPKMKLYRQPTNGDWGPVLEEIRVSLEKIVN